METNLKPEKILVIEGDGALGEQIVAVLKADGYSNATLVKSGLDGLKAIYDTLPHLVLLDITLPGMDGYDILAKKASEPLLAKIPVFLLSTQAVPINMRKVPLGSVKEFIMALHADPAQIASKIDRHFGHESLPAAVPGSGSGDSGVPKIKLLWVEDDKLIGTILARKLVASGFDLFHAPNGEDALEAVKSSIPDVIVVDLLLPGLSGFDILQRMNDDPRLKVVPKMVLSNLSKPSDIERAKALGAQKFLVKAAASLDQIVAEIRGLCKK